jgi:hypothetical protein
VYILAYSCGLETLEEAEKKHAHYSLLIDVSGESTEQVLHGLEVHFIFNFATRYVSVRFTNTTKPFSAFLFVKESGNYKTIMAPPWIGLSP